MRALVAAGVVGGVLMLSVVTAAATWFEPAWSMLTDEGRVARTYYIPSESMMPTLRLNDRIRPKLAGRADLYRGAVIVFDGGRGTRVDRIVAIGGDTLELRGGRVRVNGREAAYRAGGVGPTLSDGTPTRLWLEQLPGEPHAHRTLDAGPSPQDDFGPVHVAPGALFVLGDARDKAADSRFAAEEGGVGAVPVTAVIGTVDRLLWASGLRSMGRAIDEADRMPTGGTP